MKLKCLTIALLLLASMIVGLFQSEEWMNERYEGTRSEITGSDKKINEGTGTRGNIVVDDSGGQDHLTIGAAITAANPGDTIYVYAGTYNENVVVDNTLTLIGNGSADTIIDGGGSGDVVEITEDWVNMSGFLVMGSGSSSSDAGIQLTSASNCNISSCNVTNNEIGIYLYFNCNFNRIINNTCGSNDENGIYVYRESNDNNIANNTCNWNDNDGIYLYWDSDGNTMANNTCKGNDDGISIRSGEGNTVMNNTCNWNNDNGIYLYASDNEEVINNSCNRNGDDGIFCYYYSDDNTIANNTCNWNDDNGIEVCEGEYNDIINNSCNRNGDNGIELDTCVGANATNNTCSNDRYAIYLYRSENLFIANNTMIECGLFIAGWELKNWNTHTVDTNNTVNGRTVYYWKNITGGVTPYGAGQVLLANCSGVTIENQNGTNGSVFGVLGYSSMNTIANNTCYNNEWGMYLYESDNNTMVNNTLNGNDHGAYLYSSDNNTLNNNSCSDNNDHGIYLTNSDSNMITNNTCNTNDNGIYLFYSDSSTITNNTCYNNSCGICLYYGDSNNINNNTCTDNNNNGIRLYSSDNNYLTKNTCDDNNEHGIYLDDSEGDTLTNNTMIECGIFITGGELKYWNTHTVDANNTVNGGSVYYWKNTEGGIIPPGAGQVILANCTRVTLENQDLSNGSAAVLMINSSMNTIANNTCDFNHHHGLTLYLSSANTIVNNTMDTNIGYGINIADSSSSNSIHHNNFLDNNDGGVQAYDSVGGNSWNLDYPMGGNYWNDLTGADYLSGIDRNILGSDGYGDTAYYLDGGTGAGDLYPSTGPYGEVAGSILITSHEDGQYVDGTILLEADVTANHVSYVEFYMDGVLRATDHEYPYQFILDTATLTEDSTVTFGARVVKSQGTVETSIDLRINNEVATGNFITVGTLKNTYRPDQDISVQVNTSFPPAFDTLDLIVILSGPDGDPVFNSNLTFPYDTRYAVILPIASDAVTGTYTVNVHAYGSHLGDLIWNAANTTTFEVSGENIHEQLQTINHTVSGMNITVNYIGNRVIDIRSNLTKLNLSLDELHDDIDHMNTTIPASMNELSDQLSGVNTSLLTRLTNIRNNLTNSETNILDRLGEVNTSLYADISNQFANITNDVMELNSSMSAQLTGILNNMTTKHDALQTWLDLVIGLIDSNLTNANRSLNDHLSEMETLTADFYVSLNNSLFDVMSGMVTLGNNLSHQHTVLNNTIDLLSDTLMDQHTLSRTGILTGLNYTMRLLETLDQNMTAHDSDLMGLLADLSALVYNENNLTREQLIENAMEILGEMGRVEHNISRHDAEMKDNITTMETLINTLSELHLSKLGSDIAEITLALSDHGTTIGSVLFDIDADIEAFKEKIEGRLSNITERMVELGKLEDILNDLQALDRSLEDAEKELSVDMEKYSGEETDEIGLQATLLYVALGLLVVIIIFMFFQKRGREQVIIQPPIVERREPEPGTTRPQREKAEDHGGPVPDKESPLSQRKEEKEERDLSKETDAEEVSKDTEELEEESEGE